MQPAVELDRVSKSFRVRRAPRPGAGRSRSRSASPADTGRHGRRPAVVLDRPGRARGVHRTQRRGQVDDAEDAGRDSSSRRGRGARAGPRAVAGAAPPRVSDRHRVRAALAAVVSAAAARHVRAARARLRNRSASAPATDRRADVRVRDRRAGRHAGAPAVARRAHALRDRRQPAPFAAHALSRRADDRPRRLGEGGDPRAPADRVGAGAASRCCSRRTTPATWSACARA